MPVPAGDDGSHDMEPSHGTASPTHPHVPEEAPVARTASATLEALLGDDDEDYMPPDLRATPSVLTAGAMFGGPDEIVPGVYLGGFLALEACGRIGVEFILSVVDVDSFDQIQEILGNLIDGSKGHKADVMHIDLFDRPTANILEHLDPACDYIAKALAGGGKVLVHCMAGVSRSATLVAAHIVRAQGAAPEEAVALVRSKRPCANPNSGFVKQLQAWHSMGMRLDRDHPEYKRLFEARPPVPQSDFDIPREVPIIQMPATSVKRDPGAASKNQHKPAAAPGGRPANQLGGAAKEAGEEAGSGRPCCAMS